MRPEFYEVYRDLNELYRRLFPDIRDLRTVDEAITETVSDLGLARVLRPDARLFLLVNLHQMVALPLAYAERSRTEPLPVDQIIRHDVRIILKAAREESNEGEISGHAVMSAASRVWRKLSATELDIWG